MNRIAGIFVGICVASIVLGYIIAGNNVNAWFTEASHQAVEVDFLFKFMLIASVFVFLIVHVFLIYFAAHYRKRKTDPVTTIGEPIHGNTRLEIVWAILPAIFLVFLTGLSFGVWSDMHTTRANELVVQVIGYQYGFEFRYPQYFLSKAGSQYVPSTQTDRQPNNILADDKGKWGDQNQLYLPVNRTVRFDEVSRDVIHSFWVPEFREKQDIVPGYITHLRATTLNRPGIYPVVCTEFCGVGHSVMGGNVEVGGVKQGGYLHILSQADWEKWIQKRTVQARQDAATLVSQAQGSTTGNGSLTKANTGATGVVRAEVSYKRDIQTLWANRCAACHIQAQMGGLNLSSYEALMKGGNSAAGGPVNGSVVVPANHEMSYLWDVIKGVNLMGGQRMPLGGPYLSENEIAVVAKWIDTGAKNN